MVQPALQIGHLTEDDIASCAALMAHSEPWTRYGIDEAGAHALWTGALSTGATVAVARLGPVTVGFAWYIAGGAFGLGGYLKLLGVHPEVRGRGVGAALLRHTEERALANGEDDLFLLVSHFNAAAQRFYRAHGYRQVGRIPNYVRPGIAELLFRKRLHMEDTIGT